MHPHRVLVVVLVLVIHAACGMDVYRRRRGVVDVAFGGEGCKKDSECPGVKDAAKPMMMCCGENKENGNSRCFSAAYSVLSRHKDKVELAEMKILARYQCPVAFPKRLDADNETPKNNAEKFHHKVDPIVGGVSAGLKDDLYYWTIGAIVCDKAAPKARFALTNWHNVVDDHDRDLDLPVMQPAMHPGDFLEESRQVGTVVYRNHEDVPDDMIGNKYDFSILKFDEGIKANAEVMTSDGPKPVLGVKPLASVTSLVPVPDLYLSGRSSGWVKATYQNDMAEFGGNMPPGLAFAAQSGDNPKTLYPGNSGSVVWMKDKLKDGYWAVALFSGQQGLQDIPTILTKASTALTKQLEICVHPSVTAREAINDELLKKFKAIKEGLKKRI